MTATKAVSRCRSCKACIKAKRRCEPRSPKCIRCSSKDLDCVYQNEPLLGFRETHTSPEKDRSMVLDAISECRDTGLDPKSVGSGTMFSPILESLVAQGFISESHSTDVSSIGLTTYEPAIPTVYWRGDVATVRCMIGHLKDLPATFARETSTPFIHRQLYDQWLPTQMQDVYSVCGSYASAATSDKDMVFRIVQLKLDQLVENHPTNQSFEKVLASVQALMLYLIICLFDGDARQRKLAEPHVHTLGQWSRQLWDEVPRQMPGTWSAWEAWVFAESVRRTIVISHLIQSVYLTIKMGYHVHTLWVEALPFELHTLLWDAPSLGAWNALIPTHRPSMVSYREYVESFSKGRVNPPKTFETLLLLACCGKAGFETTLQSSRFLDSQQ